MEHMRDALCGTVGGHSSDLAYQSHNTSLVSFFKLVKKCVNAARASSTCCVPVHHAALSCYSPLHPKQTPKPCLRRFFRGIKGLVIPRVHWELTALRVLASECLGSRSFRVSDVSFDLLGLKLHFTTVSDLRCLA